MLRSSYDACGCSTQTTFIINLKRSTLHPHEGQADRPNTPSDSVNPGSNPDPPARHTGFFGSVAARADLRGLGGGIRSLFRAELVLRRFLAPSRGPVSAAHFGISGPLSSREAETGFDSPGDWFAVATRRFHQLPRRQAAAQPGTPEPMPDAAMMSSPHPGRTRA